MADGQHLIDCLFDRAFSQEANQFGLFEFVRGKYRLTNHSAENVSDVLDGFHSTILAHRQTGSGKTYTMFEPHWDDNYGWLAIGTSEGGNIQNSPKRTAEEAGFFMSTAEQFLFDARPRPNQGQNRAVIPQ